VARLAAQLIRVHHRFDPGRFDVLADDLESGYEQWLRRALLDDKVVVTLASVGERVVGYAYGELEGLDWIDLIGEHGRVHDLFVDESFRGRGIGEALMRETVTRLVDLGASRILLDTAWSNEAARRVFARIGYRPTVIEMMLTPLAPGK